MKVLIVTIFRYPHQGGLSSHIDILKKGFGTHNIKSQVYNYNTLNRIERSMIQIIFALFYLLNKQLGSLIQHVIISKFLFFRVKKAQIDYDIIHFMETSSLSCNRFYKPTVLTIHGDYSNMSIGEGLLKRGSQIHRYYEKIETRSLMQVNKIIAVDERLKRYAHQLTGKIDILKQINFVDLSEFDIKIDKENFKKKHNIPSNKKILLCPRRLVKKNGVIYASHILQNLDKSFHLVYLGNGPESVDIELFKNNNNLQESISIINYVQREEMPSFYQISDYVLIPSITVANGMQEATSIACIEAMASKKIVIASAIGGLNELIKHLDTGILFEEKNVSQAVMFIQRIESDPILKRDISQNAYNHCNREFCHIKASKKIIDIYQGLKQ
jgi:glycogen synthase